MRRRNENRTKVRKLLIFNRRNSTPHPMRSIESPQAGGKRRNYTLLLRSNSYHICRDSKKSCRNMTLHYQNGLHGLDRTHHTQVQVLGINGTFLKQALTSPTGDPENHAKPIQTDWRTAKNKMIPTLHRLYQCHFKTTTQARVSTNTRSRSQ